MVYRAYRVPYEWVPQLELPIETEIAPLDVNDYRLPGAAPRGAVTTVEVEGTISYGEGALCVARTDELTQKERDRDA